jgi:hypothetical protein
MASSMFLSVFGDSIGPGPVTLKTGRDVPPSLGDEVVQKWFVV